MAIKSTLAEIHNEVGKYFFAILNGLDPTIWVNNNQVFYCPVATFADAVRILQERDKNTSTNKNLKFPFATVTRGDYDISNDLTRASYVPKFVNDTPNPDNSEDAVTTYKLQGVKIIYNLVIYHNSLDNIERVSETLVFARAGGTKHDYISSVVPQLQTGFQIVYSDMPSPEQVPANEDLLRGHGSIYALRLPFRVDGAIARSMAIEKRILTAIARIRDINYVDNSIEYGQITITE